LEADLGIDSLKRAEMLGKVTAHFGLGESAEDGRFIAQSTLADLAGLITDVRGDAPASVVSAGSVWSVGEVLEELRELYASTLGYPVEVITGDADLEADLGIDSLKRAEMLGKVTAHFGLGESAEDGRFIAQSTLADLAGLVTAVQASAR
ncbi:phosphopantetheine-binding protein, partial [Streptomyces sp. NPDC101393]|uniref:phosphopantetheine-binding protein n=1 Tax=Streptomyces sp. NPDC101393 TaxID=3366141 RepID=UPI003812A205